MFRIGKNRLLLFVFLLGISATRMYSQSPTVDTLEVEYHVHGGGPAPYACEALFVREGDHFVLKKSMNTKEYECENIDCETINNFLEFIETHKSKELSKFFKITDGDYYCYNLRLKDVTKKYNFISIIDPIFIRRISNYNYSDYKNIKMDKFLLASEEYEKAFDREDIISSIFIPHLRMYFSLSNGTQISVYPYSYFEGSPWIIRHSNESGIYSNRYYIDYFSVLEFLKYLNLDGFVHFHNRFNMMFHLATYLKEIKSKEMSELECVPYSL